MIKIDKLLDSNGVRETERERESDKHTPDNIITMHKNSKSIYNI